VVRRWVIRGMLVWFCAVCVTAWVASYWPGARLGVNRLARPYLYMLQIYDGQAELGRWEVDLLISGNSGPSAKSQQYDFLGFCYFRNGTDRSLTIPLWFPTLASGLGLWWVWRKTRAKYAGKAFPVVTTNGQEARP
jgi:hypothetical protein